MLPDPPPTSAVPSFEYDRFADIYQVWTDSAPATSANLPFYVEAYLAAAGPVVELGVGDGRIAVAAALRGCDIIGVDQSAVMLARCRERARTAGVDHRLILCQADFRDFALAQPAGLIALPYHSLGHLVSLDAKRQALGHIFQRLRPGGRFVYDDFCMTPALIERMRQVQLRAAYRSPTGAERLLWVTSLVDEAAQAITVVTFEDELDQVGVLACRRHRRLSLSWLEPAQAQRLLEQAGFTIEACLGDFEGTAFAPGSAQEQVWIARRPGG